MLRYGYYEGAVLVPVAYFADKETADVCVAGLEKRYKGRALICDDPGYRIEFPEDSEIVIVYFESGCHADAVACLTNEMLYYECCSGFAKLAKKNRMIVTESVSPDEETWKEPLWRNFAEKIDYEKEHGKKGWLK